MGGAVVWPEMQGRMFLQQALFFGEQRDALSFQGSVVERALTPAVGGV
jgi:hypothetical protein